MHAYLYGESKVILLMLITASHAYSTHQTNAIYRFYTYELVIDDAPTIVYGCIGQSKIWGYSVFLRYDGRICRGFGVKNGLKFAGKPVRPDGCVEWRVWVG